MSEKQKANIEKLVKMNKERRDKERGDKERGLGLGISIYIHI